MDFKDLCRRCKVSGGHKPCHYRHQLELRGTCSHFADRFATKKENAKSITEVEEFFKIWKDQKGEDSKK